MGLFDFLMGSKEEIAKFTDIGLEMKIDDLIYHLSRTKKKAEAVGYHQALRIKFNKLDENGADESELMHYFNMAFNRNTHTEMGKNAMFPVMQRRGLAHKESGSIIRDYDNYY